ncbi:hypothetical protein [Teichococcus aestuarii]
MQSTANRALLRRRTLLAGSALAMALGPLAGATPPPPRGRTR